MPDIADQKALRALAKRLADVPKQVDNGDLHAGSPMFFYCKVCEHESDRLPESYVCVPNKFCGLCKELLDATSLTPTTLREEAQALAGEETS